MARYGVERPPPPIAWNDRQRMIEQERADQPDAEQSALFALEDTRKTAYMHTQGVQDALPACAMKGTCYATIHANSQS